MLHLDIAMHYTFIKLLTVVFCDACILYDDHGRTRFWQNCAGESDPNAASTDSDLRCWKLDARFPITLPFPTSISPILFSHFSFYNLNTEHIHDALCSPPHRTTSRRLSQDSHRPHRPQVLRAQVRLYQCVSSSISLVRATSSRHYANIFLALPFLLSHHHVDA